MQSTSKSLHLTQRLFFNAKLSLQVVHIVPEEQVEHPAGHSLVFINKTTTTKMLDLLSFFLLFLVDFINYLVDLRAQVSELVGR